MRAVLAGVFWALLPWEGQERPGSIDPSEMRWGARKRGHGAATRVTNVRPINHLMRLTYDHRLHIAKSKNIVSSDDWLSP